MEIIALALGYLLGMFLIYSAVIGDSMLSVVISAVRNTKDQGNWNRPLYFIAGVIITAVCAALLVLQCTLIANPFVGIIFIALAFAAFLVFTIIRKIKFRKLESREVEKCQK